MLDKIQCFFRGHTGELVIFEPERSAMFGGSLWPRQQIYCERCGENINTRWPQKTPEDQPHLVDVFEKSGLYRSACWCAWRSAYWREIQSVAAAEGQIHLEEMNP